MNASDVQVDGPLAVDAWYTPRGVAAVRTVPLFASARREAEFVGSDASCRLAPRSVLDQTPPLGARLPERARARIGARVGSSVSRATSVTNTPARLPAVQW